jgi:flotillin
MDIRDAKGSKIIHDIMAKKSSQIEMESRTVVAHNKQQASIAEIDAQQMVDIRNQEQQQQVGQRRAAQEREVGVAREEAAQQIQASAKVTMERSMAVAQVEVVRKAEMDREATLVKADAQRQAAVIVAEAQRAVDITRAEGERQKQVLVAQGQRDSSLLSAEGIKAEGEARGAAEQALLLAPVNSQIVLAEKIAALPGYQSYLVSVRQVEAQERVGMENARALAAANIKVIATSGNAGDGMASVSEVLGAKGGVQIGAMLQGLANTDTGAAVLNRFGVLTDEGPAYKPNGSSKQ